MALNVGDGAQTPGIASEVYIPDQLIAGNAKLVTQPITVGAGTLKRGRVLGQITEGAVTSTPGANTGNGTVGSITRGSKAKVGSYALKATSATNFTVTDPDGLSLPPATVGTAYTNPELNLTITAGGTPFVANDSFTLAVAVGSGAYIDCVKTAVDGSQVPTAILADDSDASGGAVLAGAYLAGEFNVNAISFDASWTASALTAALRPLQIYLKNAVTASDPS